MAAQVFIKDKKKTNYSSAQYCSSSRYFGKQLLGAVSFNMEILPILKNAIEERFKADSVVKRLEKMICKIAEDKTFEKYKEKKVFRNGMQFELIGVRASFYVWDIDINEVELGLAYAVTAATKLPKAKREKVEEVKKQYDRDKRLEWNNYKVELWEELRYEVKLENVLSGNINLRVE